MIAKTARTSKTVNTENKSEFEIHEYHRNIPKDELIADLQRVASENRLSTISQTLYAKLGKYTHKVFYSNFGSWNNALKAAGLEISSRRKKYQAKNSLRILKMYGWY